METTEESYVQKAYELMLKDQKYPRDLYDQLGCTTDIEFADKLEDFFVKKELYAETAKCRALSQGLLVIQKDRVSRMSQGIDDHFVYLRNSNKSPTISIHDSRLAEYDEVRVVVFPLKRRDEKEGGN